MSNGEPSRTPYIIICQLQTEIAAQQIHDPALRAKVIIASRGALNMVTYIGIVANNELTIADTKPVSDCLHWFENNAAQNNKDEIEAKVAELINITDSLHKKFSEY